MPVYGWRKIQCYARSCSPSVLVMSVSTLQEEIEIATAAHRGTTTEKNVDANIDLHTLGIFGALATFHVKRMISL